ncbi:annexin-B12-like isoform X1 [Penaeus monodon]|uniref:annexin-B12-like isoform X1 n=2 Tax=Penaeus monodon TaxID=6687 RepID=UPI0018A7BAAC|nr:annexin-B12-like isoform X1 [Penaeus monodon]
MENEYKGTITPKKDFDVEFAAKRFQKAFKGIGSDEKMIIKMLVQHDSLQRQEIEEKYKEMYGKDLIDDLKDELGGHFEDAAVALMTAPSDLLCGALHDALKGAGTDEKTIIDILCCRDPEEIDSLRGRYEYLYDEDLDEVVKSELSGDFQRLIRGLVAGGRDEEDNVDSANARKDAQDLYDAGIGSNADTDEAEFIRILNTRSYGQLKEIFDAYDSIADETIEESIEKEFSGDIKAGLLAIVQRVRDPLGFYAERLNNAMAGAGTDDKALIRILVSRSQTDLADIRSRYKELYSTDLVEDIEADCSGDYCKLLVALVEGESQ